MSMGFLGKITKKHKIDRIGTIVKPLDSISKIELLKPHKSNVSAILVKDREFAIKRVNTALELCRELIRRYNLIVDAEYKVHGNGFSNILLIKEFKSRLESFLRMLRSINKDNELEELLGDLESYFYKLDNYLPVLSNEINKKYVSTTVESDYYFTGDTILKWREEALKVFTEVELSFYNDYQLKEYVVAYKMGVSSDLIMDIMDPRRAPEHIRLMFLLPEKEMVEVFNHPEYTVDQVKSLFPDLVSEIENKKRT